LCAHHLIFRLLNLLVLSEESPTAKTGTTRTRSINSHLASQIGQAVSGGNSLLLMPTHWINSAGEARCPKLTLSWNERRLHLSVKALALLRRAEDRAERAEHAAVAVLGAQPRTAFPTVIKKSAGIDRHVFALREAAMRTGDDRMKNDVIHDFKAAGSTDALRRPHVTTSRRGVKFQALTGELTTSVNAFKPRAARMGTAGTRTSVSLLRKGINRPRASVSQSGINIMRKVISL
jgi:hypothetical protein